MSLLYDLAPDRVKRLLDPFANLMLALAPLLLVWNGLSVVFRFVWKLICGFFLTLLVILLIYYAYLPDFVNYLNK